MASNSNNSETFFAVHSSPAVRAGPLVFLSGHFGVSPLSRRLVSRFSELDDEGRAFATGMLSVDGWIEDVGAQFWQTCRNLQSLLDEEGSSLARVVLLNFYSRQMHHHHLIDSMRSRLFLPGSPAPNTGMQAAANPAGALMQASAIGFVPGREPWERRVIEPAAVSQGMSRYDLGVQVGPFLFTGDLVPASQKLQRVVTRYEDVPTLPQALRPSGRFRRSYEETIRAQTWFIYENIRDVLKDNGAGLEDIVRLRVYFVDMAADAGAFTEIHEAFFDNHRPVVVLAGAEKLGRPDFRVAIEVIAVVPGHASSASYKPRFFGNDVTDRLVGSSSMAVAAGPYCFLANAPASRATLAIEQVGRLLIDAQASLEDVVSINVYLRSINEVTEVDEALRHFFPARPPAVTIIEAPALPVADSRVDVEVVAYKQPPKSK